MGAPHQFGKLAVAAIAENTFEVVELTDGGAGLALARIDVDESDFPALRICELGREERTMERGLKPVGRALIASRRSDHPTCFELTVESTDEGIGIQLSGDHRCMAGDRHYRLFWWRAECRLVDGEFRVTGPHLTGDPDS